MLMTGVGSTASLPVLWRSNRMIPEAELAGKSAAAEVPRTAAWQVAQGLTSAECGRKLSLSGHPRPRRAAGDPN
jgi:hypothetical protein